MLLDAQLQITKPILVTPETESVENFTFSYDPYFLEDFIMQKQTTKILVRNK